MVPMQVPHPLIDDNPLRISYQGFLLQILKSNPTIYPKNKNFIVTQLWRCTVSAKSDVEWPRRLDGSQK